MARHNIRYGIERNGQERFAAEQVKNGAYGIDFRGQVAAGLGKQVIGPTAAFRDGEARILGFCGIYAVAYGEGSFHAERERNGAGTLIDGLCGWPIELDLFACRI